MMIQQKPSIVHFLELFGNEIKEKNRMLTCLSLDSSSAAPAKPARPAHP